jgi:transcriptional regulator with XRE-family HTH domain
MATLRSKLGKAIRDLRKAAGYSQESFADACRVHRTRIGSVERGEANLRLSSLEVIARTLKVPISRLFIDAEQQR